MVAARISGLFFYPVKSLAGISAETLTLEAAGPRFDREWMVVGEEGNFITQRECPGMQLIIPSLSPDALTLNIPNSSRVRVPLAASPRPTRRVSVWGTRVDAFDEGENVRMALTAYLGRPAALVRLGPAGRRELGPAEADYEVRFADAAPLLLCNEESLRELAARAGQELAMERFRPNLVVTGVPAFGEDAWSGFTVNDFYFPALRPCSRCVVTTIDPLTAAKGPEPLRTLATFRRQGKKVLFGKYFLSIPATIKVGDLLLPEVS